MTQQTPVRATLESESGEFDDSAGVWTFHGTVIENDETTNGANSPKHWPAAELEKAAGSLTEKPVVNGHNYDENGQPLNEFVEGKVTNDWYNEDVGWQYEMEIGDAELARKLSNGHLEVSFHGGGAAAGETDDGAAKMSNIYSRDLAIVPFGGARGNDVQAGAAPSPASAAALSATLEADNELVELDDAGQDTPDNTRNEGAESSADTTDSDMSDNPDNGTDLDLDGRVLIDEERHAELTAAENDLESLSEEKEELEAELNAKEEQIDKVRGIYADKLAELSGFSAEFFEDKDIEMLESELANQLDAEEDEAAEAALSGTPMPQSGDGGEGSATDSETDEEVAELKERKEAALEAGMTGAAEHYDEQIEALTGGN
jgi:hypothetical protein